MYFAGDQAARWKAATSRLLEPNLEDSKDILKRK